jgi:uncharacterized membrane protein YgcG
MSQKKSQKYEKVKDSLKGAESVSSSSKASTKRYKKVVWLMALVAALVLVGAAGMYRETQASKERFTAMTKQRQVMQEYWQSQGLNQEEINQKLMEQRQLGREGFEPTLFSRLLFTFHRTTGTGPGGGRGDGSGFNRGGGEFQNNSQTQPRNGNQQ